MVYAFKKEYARHKKALQDLHKEQEATKRMMIDDRELDLTSEYYERIGKICEQMKKESQS